jgi:hypothetical protein
MIVNTPSAVPIGMCRQLIAATTKEKIRCLVARMKNPVIRFSTAEPRNQTANTT